MHAIVAGCGRVGSHLAHMLSYEGHNVVVIDREESSFKRLGSTFNGITLQGIAFDEELLLEAGIEEAEAFAAVTNFDNSNLMAAQIASSIYRVPHVIARLYNPDKEATFRRLKIDYVCGTTMVAERVMTRILESAEHVHLDRPDLGVKIVEFTLGDKARDMMALELEVPGEVRIVAWMRNGKRLELQPEGGMEAGDKLIVAATPAGLAFLSDFQEPFAPGGPCSICA